MDQLLVCCSGMGGLCHRKCLGYYILIKEDNIQYMQTTESSGPNSAQDWIQFSKADLTHAHGRENPQKCVGGLCM